MIIDSSSALSRWYHRLGPGDLITAPILPRWAGHAVLVDLLTRGVQCFPSARARVLNASKSAQALVFGQWMIPHTTVIHRAPELLAAMTAYRKIGIQEVVTKAEGKHCGYGVCRWHDMEMLYNQVVFSADAYPFVLQPFVAHFRDVRVIVADDYVEAYARENAHGFRNNLSAGGTSRACSLGKKTEDMCRSIMQRGGFPWAHIDLMLSEDGNSYLLEISLNGGLGGAAISRGAWERKKQTIKTRQIERYAAKDKGGAKQQ